MTLTEKIQALPHKRGCKIRKLVKRRWPEFQHLCDCGLDEAISQARKADAVIVAAARFHYAADGGAYLSAHKDLRKAIADYKGARDNET